MFKRITAEQAAFLIEQTDVVFRHNEGPTIAIAGPHRDLGDLVLFNNATDNIVSIDPAKEEDFNTWAAS